MIWAHFKTNAILDVVYNIERLTELKWLGDSKIHDFYMTWDNIMRNMKDRLSDDTLMDLLARKLKPPKVLESDLANFHRRPVGHEEHTHKHLRDSMLRAVRLSQEARNRELTEVGFKGGRATPAVPGEEDEAPPSDAKKKRKKKSKNGNSDDAAPAPQPKAKAKAKAKAKDGCTRTAKECKFKHAYLPKNLRDRIPARDAPPQPHVTTRGMAVRAKVKGISQHVKLGLTTT
jgi:hypothetical protein